MPVFEFRASDHTYWLDGCLIPGTTQILKSAGVIDDTFYNDAARIRGQAAHAACHYFAEGDLDMERLDPALVPYVTAYGKFLTDTGFIPKECEKPIYHPTYLYGSTPDHIGDLKKADAIAELKTGTMMPWTSLQTAFQAMARWPNDYMTKIRIGVELSAKGTYRFQFFEDLNDFDVAAGMLASFNWKKNHLKGA